MLKSQGSCEVEKSTKIYLFFETIDSDTYHDFNFDHGPLILRNLLNINRCLRQQTQTPSCLIFYLVGHWRPGWTFR